MKHYLKVAGASVGINTSYDPQRATDKRYMDRNTVPPVITAVIREHHRWETVPNRREPITKNMVRWWLHQARTSPIDSFESVIADWMVLGTQLGMRKSEWTQSSKNKTFGSEFDLNVDGSSKAFIASDFTFHNSQNGSIYSPHSSKCNTKQNSSSTDLLKVRWRFQNNNDNGQQILFSNNTDDPDFCVVAADKRIVERAQRLQIPANHPIAVYMLHGKIHNIVDVKVRRSIQ